MGEVKIPLSEVASAGVINKWYPLSVGQHDGEEVTGEIHLQLKALLNSKSELSLEDLRHLAAENVVSPLCPLNCAHVFTALLLLFLLPSSTSMVCPWHPIQILSLLQILPFLQLLPLQLLPLLQLLLFLQIQRKPHLVNPSKLNQRIHHCPLPKPSLHGQQRTLGS